MSEVRVLHLIDGLNIGGAENLLIDLCSGLIKHGFTVGVGYSTPGPLVDVLANKDFDITHLPRLMRIDPFLFIGIMRLIKRWRPHIVHTHLFKSDFHGRLAAYIAGVPVVLSTLHSMDRWAKKWPLGKIYGWTANIADQIISVSDDVRSFYLDHTGIPEEKIITIQNGVVVERYSGSRSPDQDLRQKFGFNDPQVVFGIIGRLTTPKDHDTFLRAAAIIKEQVPESRFLVVGDGPLREELEHLARDLRLSGEVFFTGFRRDIPSILSSIDVLVISSQWEGMPVTLLEGMAASRAVVATEVGGIPSVVEPGETGILVPPMNADLLAKACVKLARNPDLRIKMGEKGFSRVRARFNSAEMVNRTVALYTTHLQESGLGQLISSDRSERVIDR